MSSEELLSRAILFADSKIKEQESLIATMRPKALFADAVSTSHTTILIGDLAKLLKQNGIAIGQNRLFEWLRDFFMHTDKLDNWAKPAL